jgi:hypothetical protein
MRDNTLMNIGMLIPPLATLILIALFVWAGQP